MQAAAIEGKALLAAPRDPEAPAAATMVEVARRYGVSPFRQMREMFALRYGPGRLALPEYYANGLYDPALSLADKQAFVGRIGSWAINDRLSPADLTHSRVFVADKVMYTALLRQLGLATTQTLAVAHGARNFGVIPALRGPRETAAFLQSADYPLFGKPCEGRGSVGSALFAARDEDHLVLGTGRRVSIAAFANEIFTDYPDGFIFQSALVQHRVLSDVIGQAVGTVRVVTIRDDLRSRVLYTVWKIPSPTAMSDNFWQAGSMIAQVDSDGRVGRCRIGIGLHGRDIAHHPVSDQRFDTVTIPHWAQVQSMACAAHDLFPEFGIVGWDIAITPDCPVIVECNDNPYHVLWQLPNGRGILNADFQPALDRAAEISADMLAEKHALFDARARQKGRKRR